LVTRSVQTPAALNRTVPRHASGTRLGLALVTFRRLACREPRRGSRRRSPRQETWPKRKKHCARSSRGKPAPLETLDSAGRTASRLWSAREAVAPGCLIRSAEAQGCGHSPDSAAGPSGANICQGRSWVCRATSAQASGSASVPDVRRLRGGGRPVGASRPSSTTQYRSWRSTTRPEPGATCSALGATKKRVA
jgi:hypothetical protein